MDLEREHTVRGALFAHLDRLSSSGESHELRWEQTEYFTVHAERFIIRQTHGRGIAKPAGLDAALSITTAYTPMGKRRPYEDSVGADGLQRYHYEGADPNRATNRALRACFEYSLPLVYFIGVDKGLYAAVYPVYVVADDPQRGEVTISPVVVDLTSPRSETYHERRYAESLTRRRIHQPLFRADVLHAYRTRCSICHLGHRELLDAAHIIPDSRPNGEPVVPNGLALCKIHHAAFDANLVGIRPDYRVEVNDELLQEHDGPMLRHGIQAAHGQLIDTPRRVGLRPDPQRLEERYEEFRASR